MNLGRGKFRVRGDTIEVHPAYDETVLRIELFGDEVERHHRRRPAHRRAAARARRAASSSRPRTTSPATSGCARRSSASRPSCRSGWPGSRQEGKLLEAQRLRMRTQYDLEMIQEVGYCNGIENYSMHIDGRSPRRAAVHAARLLPRRLPARHRREPRQAVPQLHGQYEGDRSRKDTLVEHGFRLPSARATTGRCGSRRSSSGSTRCVFLSATPAPYELQHVAARSSSRSCARPAWSTPRSSSSRPRARSTT